MTKFVNILLLLSSVFLLTSVLHAAELSGTWTGTDDTGEPYTFFFTSTNWSLTNDIGDNWHEGTYTFNDNSKPKQIDLFFTNSAENQFIEKTALYIYKIEKKTLTLTGSDPGNNYRPSEFSEGGATQTFIVVNEDMVTDETPDNEEHSDDDKVKVYMNCFVGMVQQ